jgi:hypothetical protein
VRFAASKRALNHRARRPLIKRPLVRGAFFRPHAPSGPSPPAPLQPSETGHCFASGAPAGHGGRQGSTSPVCGSAPPPLARTHLPRLLPSFHRRAPRPPIPGPPGLSACGLVKLAVAGDAPRCVWCARCARWVHVRCSCCVHVLLLMLCVCVCISGEWGHSMLYKHKVCASAWACAGQRCSDRGPTQTTLNPPTTAH